MKRILFLATAAFLFNLCVGQNGNTLGSHHAQDPLHMIKKAPVTVFNGTETRPGNNMKTGGNYQPRPVASSETIIGTTTYDLQTNTAIARRLFSHGSGKLSATWTFSTDMGGSWPDRGTGYNYFDGSSWGANPTVRIETIRTGWPEVISTSTGYEVVICHDPANGVLVKNDRATIGSGSWTEVNLTAISPTNLWPRMAVGGSNGQTIHVIGLTTPVGNGGNPYNGLDGALLYSRSQDGGVTWDILAVQITGADTSNFSGFSGDSYCIDARGDVVAIVASGLGDGIAMWKSTDNGSTWTMSWPAKPQIPKFAEDVHNTDIILNGDSMYSSDGTSAVLIDNNDVVHAFWGRQYIINDDITDGLLSYFPGINAIDYWNENMGEDNHDSIAGGYMDNTNWVGWASYR
ncbi:MAG: sialidase family protein, partial [Flavobacteriales bacterium]